MSAIIDERLEDILLDALELAEELEEGGWAKLILTILTVLQEGLEDEFITVCDSFLEDTIDRVISSNRIGNA